MNYKTLAAAAQKKFSPERFVRVQDVCVFAEHETKDSKGRPQKYDREALEKIIARCNERISETEDYATLTAGHTPDEESDKPSPPVLGFVGPYRLAQIGNKKKRYAILADEWHFKEDHRLLEKLPRRSVEVWMDDDMGERFFDPVAALGAETPRLDLGVKFSRGGRVEKYSARSVHAYAKRRADKPGEQWITIGSDRNGDGESEGGGQAVRIDKDGNITAGPDWMAKDGIKNVKDFGKKEGGEKKKKEDGKGNAAKDAIAAMRRLPHMKNATNEQLAFSSGDYFFNNSKVRRQFDNHREFRKAVTAELEKESKQAGQNDGADFLTGEEKKTPKFDDKSGEQGALFANQTSKNKDLPGQQYLVGDPDFEDEEPAKQGGGKLDITPQGRSFVLEAINSARRHLKQKQGEFTQDELKSWAEMYWGYHSTEGMERFENGAEFRRAVAAELEGTLPKQEPVSPEVASAKRIWEAAGGYENATKKPATQPPKPAKPDGPVSDAVKGEVNREKKRLEAKKDKIAAQIAKIDGWQGSSDSSRAGEHFHLGYLDSGKKTSRAESRRRERDLDKTIDNAKRRVKLTGDLNSVNAKLNAIESGKRAKQLEKQNERKAKRAAVKPQGADHGRQIANSLRSEGKHTLSDGTQISLSSNMANESEPTTVATFTTKSGQVYKVDTGEFPGTLKATKKIQAAAKKYLAGKLKSKNARPRTKSNKQKYAVLPGGNNTFIPNPGTEKERHSMAVDDEGARQVIAAIAGTPEWKWLTSQVDKDTYEESDDTPPVDELGDDLDDESSDDLDVDVDVDMDDEEDYTMPGMDMPGGEDKEQYSDDDADELPEPHADGGSPKEVEYRKTTYGRKERDLVTKYRRAEMEKEALKEKYARMEARVQRIERDAEDERRNNEIDRVARDFVIKDSVLDAVRERALYSRGGNMSSKAFNHELGMIVELCQPRPEGRSLPIGVEARPGQEDAKEKELYSRAVAYAENHRKATGEHMKYEAALAHVSKQQ